MELKGITGAAKKLTLDEILSGDDVFGVLTGVVARQPAKTADDRLIQSFHEINAFYQQNTRWPQETADSMDEKRLARRLRGILENPEQREALSGFDDYGILSENDNDSGEGFSLESVITTTADNSTTVITPETVTSLDDIFNSDSLGLLEVGDVDILRLDNVPSQGQGPYSDEEIGTRFECPDFWKFEAHFKKTHAALRAGIAEMHRLKTEQKLNVGDNTFLLDGVLCYIADIYKAEERKSTRKNARLRLIFENGSESNMLMRSLARAIYKDENGRQILFTDAQSIDDDLANQFSPNGPELTTGHLYVLRLLEANEQLSGFKHLHKIGYYDNRH